MEDEELPPHTRAVIRSTVEETLLSLGVDVSSPEAIVAMQRDFQHLRAWRAASEEMQRKSIWWLLATFFAGLASLVLIGLNAKFGAPAP